MTKHLLIVDYDNAQRAAIYGLLDFFQYASSLEVSESSDPLMVSILPFKADSPLPIKTDVDLIICPPRLAQDWVELRDYQIAWLRDRHQSGAILSSVCAGAFLLAQTGLLTGRFVTTHWQLGPAFQASFPDIKMDTDKILIDDGDIITAGGVMAWVDLALHLIEKFYGPAIMRQVARQFVVEPGHREQRYYSSFSPHLSHGDTPILKAQHHIQQHYAKMQTVEQLASIAGVSERTFMRRFKKATGLTPVAYIQSVRLEKARDDLEVSTRSVNEIAWSVGYEDVTSFRRLFSRQVGLTPKDYRDRFGLKEKLS